LLSAAAVLVLLRSSVLAAAPSSVVRVLAATRQLRQSLDAHDSAGGDVVVSGRNALPMPQNVGRVGVDCDAGRRRPRSPDCRPATTGMQALRQILE